MLRPIVVALGLVIACGTRAASAQESAPPKSSPEAAQIYQDARNFQNGGSFSLAAEEWQKLLKNHPQDPLAAKAQHYLGVCQLQLKQLDKAAESFQAVIKSHPKFELLDDTYLNLASTQYSLAASKPELYAAAADTFGKLIEAFPKGKYIEEAIYFQGESLYAQGKKAEAASSYVRLVTEFPKSSRRADALYALGVTQEELGKYAEAGVAYDTFLKEFANSPLATEVQMRKAETVLQAGDVAAAEKMFAAVAAVKDFASADHALYRQAYCLARLDKFAEAAALYAKIPTAFPQSASAADATIAAGRCYYKAEQFDDAAAWLRKAVDLKDENSPEAAHWLARILIRTGKQAEAADLAAAQLKAGGDSAYLVNLKLDQADALYETANRKSESLPLYVKLAKDHPQHELAPQALYNAAFAALELGQHDAAIEHATAFLAAYPQDKLTLDVKYVAAESNLQLKKYPAAEKLYAELAAAKDHPQQEAWQVRLGLAQYLQKKYAEAIATLSPAVQQLKSADAKAEAQFLIGASHFFGDKFDAAVPAFTASLAANAKWKQADETLVLLGRSQAKLGKQAEARSAFERVVADFPMSPLLDQAHYRLGELASAADDFKAAIAEYDVVATKFGSSAFAPYAVYGKGWSQLKSKEFAAGVESFTALLTRFPEHVLRADALFGRAMCRRQAGEFKGALEDLEAYLATNPDQAHKSDALYERGLTQVAAGDHAAAAKTFEELLKSDPKYAATDKVLYELGWALKSQQKHAEAAPAFARLVKEHAESPLAAEAWFHVAEDQYEKKEYAEAAKSYAAAQSKSPAGELAEKATYKLGWSHYQLKQYDEALAQFSQQLSSYAQGALAADAAFMKAECLFRLKNYKEAWPAFQAAGATKASTPAIEVLTLLHGGQSASQLKEWAAAEKTLAAIPEKFPDTPYLAEALYELGWLKQQDNRPEEALKDYEVAATKSRDAVGARSRFMMGEIYFEQKKFDQASREFQRAMFGYGGDAAAAEIKNWQAKSGYEAGRCAEVQIMSAKDDAARQKLIADAKRFYTFVVEKHPQHELAAEAKMRLEAIGKL